MEAVLYWKRPREMSVQGWIELVNGSVASIEPVRLLAR